MQAQCAFCSWCLNDDSSRAKRYIGNNKVHSWECEDVEACRDEAIKFGHQSTPSEENDSDI